MAVSGNPDNSCSKTMDLNPTFSYRSKLNFSLSTDVRFTYCCTCAWKFKVESTCEAKKTRRQKREIIRVRHFLHNFHFILYLLSRVRLYSGSVPTFCGVGGPSLLICGQVVTAFDCFRSKSPQVALQGKRFCYLTSPWETRLWLKGLGGKN